MKAWINVQRAFTVNVWYDGSVVEVQRELISEVDSPSVLQHSVLLVVQRTVMCYRHRYSNVYLHDAVTGTLDSLNFFTYLMVNMGDE